MSGDPDPLYVRARAALLDAAEALAEQREAVVLVGAQAVYLHAGDADFVASAPYTTDADFCVAPADLRDSSIGSSNFGVVVNDSALEPGRTYFGGSGIGAWGAASQTW